MGHNSSFARFQFLPWWHSNNLRNGCPPGIDSHLNNFCWFGTNPYPGNTWYPYELGTATTWRIISQLATGCDSSRIPCPWPLTVDQATIRGWKGYPQQCHHEIANCKKNSFNWCYLPVACQKVVRVAIFCFVSSQPISISASYGCSWTVDEPVVPQGQIQPEFHWIGLRENVQET